MVIPKNGLDWNANFCRVTPEITAQLLATAKHKVEGEGILATQLCSHMQDANLINTSRLNNLTGVVSAVQANTAYISLCTLYDTISVSPLISFSVL